MKRMVLIMLGLVSSLLIMAQAPEEFNYQAVVRDQAGELIANQNINVRINILQSTDPEISVYEEIHEVTSSNQGIITLRIGSNDATNSFTAINWGNSNYYLKIDKSTPAATAEPITPATFGPIACINNTFDLS